MLKKFISYYKPYRLMFSLDLAASFVISIIGMLYPVITRTMINDLIPNKKIDMVIQFSIILFFVYLIRFGLKFFVNYYGHLVGVKMQNDMRKDLLVKIESLPYTYFDNNETGKIMSRLVGDLFEISELAHHGPENFFLSFVAIIISFIYLSNINLVLTLIIFACIPCLIIILILLRKKMLYYAKLSKSKIGVINARIQNSISGIRVTKAFNRKQLEFDKFDQCANEFYEARRMNFKNFSLFFATNNFITDIFNVITLLTGGIFLLQGKISFGDYSAFIVSINLFINPINTLVNFMEQFQEGQAGFERFFELLNTEGETDKENAIDVDNLNGDIKYEGVCFKYNDSKTILNDINFTLKQGQTLALVGQTGGGKTTICHLLPRFYDNYQGNIKIGEYDIKDISLKSLRDNIGIVQQDVFLFTGTFKDNIAYGKENASDEEIVEAAKKANLYDYIMSLENGFESNIGERGLKLSGGQKQRLSIARAFLKNPPILILDEATSALDNVTEALIQDSLNTLKQGRTTIVVAHRLSTIKNADKILVIENGIIKEQGSHDELMTKPNSIYASLHKVVS